MNSNNDKNKQNNVTKAATIMIIITFCIGFISFILLDYSKHLKNKNDYISGISIIGLMIVAPILGFTSIVLYIIGAIMDGNKKK